MRQDIWNESHLYKLPQSALVHQPWRSSIQDKHPFLQSRPKKQATLSRGPKKKIAILKSEQKRNLSSLPPIDQKIFVKTFSDSKTSLNVSTSESSVEDSRSLKSETDFYEIKKSPDFLYNLYSLSSSHQTSWIKNLAIPNEMLGVTKKTIMNQWRSFNQILWENWEHLIETNWLF